MERQTFLSLLDKYLNGNATPQEQLLLEEYYKRLDALSDLELSEAEEAAMMNLMMENIRVRIVQKDKEEIIEDRPRPLWPRIAAAASILLFLSAGTYYFLHQDKPKQVAVNQEQLSPVNKGVMLTLNGGKKIQLSQKHRGLIMSIGNTKVNQSDSLLTYQGTPMSATELSMNTLTNNSGKKFSVTLADGTEVSLDMASSIIYPVNFIGKVRKVTITGQAYFKVKHNAAQPFEVIVKGQTIEDIGTEFNIDAYGNPKTTLVEGAVRVHATNNLVLKPGEEARLVGNELVKGTADLEMATIWLQGRIPLNHRTLEDVLAEVSRIYDVQFIWPDASLKLLKFGGAVSRTQKLSNVLNFFRNTGKVDFTVEGKTITVIKMDPKKRKL